MTQEGRRDNTMWSIQAAKEIEFFKKKTVAKDAKRPQPR